MVNNALVRFCYSSDNSYIEEPNRSKTAWSYLKSDIQKYNNNITTPSFLAATYENWGLKDFDGEPIPIQKEMEERWQLKDKIIERINQLESDLFVGIKWSFNDQNKIVLDKNTVDFLDKLEKESNGLGKLETLNRIQEAIDDCNNNDGQYQILDPRLEDEMEDFHKGDLNEIFEGMDHYGNELCLSPLPKIVIEKDENGVYKMPGWVVAIHAALKTKYQDTLNVLKYFNVVDKQNVMNFKEQRRSKFIKWESDILDHRPINTKARKPSQMPVKTIVTGKTNELTR